MVRLGHWAMFAARPLRPYKADTARLPRDVAEVPATDSLASNRLLCSLVSEGPGNLTRGNLTAWTFDRLSGPAKTTQVRGLALRESRTHGGNYRFLSIRCDCNCDHFHRLPLSVGTCNGSGGLWRTGWRRTAFASVSIR